MRREFDLSVDDTSFLDREAASWESIRGAGMMWVLIHEHPTPEGYTEDKVTVAITIPPNYPEGQLDMAYFYPPLARKDGRAIPNTESPQSIDGKQYQRWSRHYSAQNPWKPGEHSLETHFYLATSWLEREFAKRP